MARLVAEDLVAEDDLFGDAVAELGEASPVSLRTSDGHAVLWVATPGVVRVQRDRFLGRSPGTGTSSKRTWTGPA